MADLIGRLRAFEGSDELGNGDFSLLTEAATEIEALRAEIERLRADRDSWEQQASDRVADWHAEHLRAERLAEALREVMLWIENWSPPFTEDDEWPDTEAKAKAALHTTAAQENDDA